MTEKKPMTLTKVDIIPDESTPVRKTLYAFLESDMDMAKVDWSSNYASASSCASTLKAAIKGDEALNGKIDCCKRNPDIFLFRVGKEKFE